MLRIREISSTVGFDYRKEDRAEGLIQHMGIVMTGPLIRENLAIVKAM